jgi:hypothetical protein
MTDERRKSPRYPVDAPAQLRVGGESLAARLRDICRDAALVEADRWFPLSTRADLLAELPGVDGTILLTGTIIRLAPGQQGTHGLAILFDDVPAAAGMRIDLFVSLREES